MNDLVKEAFAQIIDPRTAKEYQDTFATAFGKVFTKRLHEVVKNPEIIARINAARILARLAATGQQDAMEVLTEVVEDAKEIDAVKLYAFQSIRDFFSLLHGDNPITIRWTDHKKPDPEAQAITALLDYVTRKPTLPMNPSPGHLAAISWVRAEAIAALGQTRYPGKVTVDEKTKKVSLERPTALVLMRVLRSDGFLPPPTRREQIAAAVGLMQLEPKKCREYQVKTALYHIGRFLVDFRRVYVPPQKVEKGDKGEKPEKPEKPELSREPWRIYAEQLLQVVKAVEDMAQNTNDKPTQEYLRAFVSTVKPMLTDIFQGKPQAASAEELSAWLDKNPSLVVYDVAGLEGIKVNETVKTDE
jgi:hypothetical protein